MISLCQFIGSQRIDSIGKVEFVHIHEDYVLYINQHNFVGKFTYNHELTPIFVNVVFKQLFDVHNDMIHQRVINQKNILQISQK